MKHLIFYLAVSLLVVFYFADVSHATSGTSSPVYTYSEECIHEGCNGEEVRELYSSYSEECLSEGCSKEEVRELVGATQYASELYQEFRRRGWRVESRHFEGLDCPHLRTDTACVAVTMWCNDICRFPDGTEGGSGWYICGACFGFDF